MRRETATRYAHISLVYGRQCDHQYVCHLIEDHANERLLIIASLWEMAMKGSRGRLTLTLAFTDLVAQHVHGNAIELLEILPHHLDVLVTLPFYHKDPFDRLIIAQGQADNIPIVSRDPAFDDYAIRRLWTWALLPRVGEKADKGNAIAAGWPNKALQPPVRPRHRHQSPRRSGRVTARLRPCLQHQASAQAEPAPTHKVGIQTLNRGPGIK